MVGGVKEQFSLQPLKQLALWSRAFQNLYQWNPGSTMCTDTSRKTETAKFAAEPKLQERRAQNAPVSKYLEQNILVI